MHTGTRFAPEPPYSKTRNNHASCTFLRIHGNIRRAGTPARRFPPRLQFPLSLLRQPRHDRGRSGHIDRPCGDPAHGRRPEALLRAARRRDLLGRGTHLPGRGTCSARKVVEGGRHPRLHRLERRGVDPGRRGAAGAGRPGAAGREAGRSRTPPRPHRTRKRADAPHGRLARSPRKTLLATLRAGSGHQRRRSRHPCAGRTPRGYKSVERVELLPYHTLGVHKYEAMGLEYKLRDVRENTPEQLAAPRPCCANTSRRWWSTDPKGTSAGGSADNEKSGTPRRKRTAVPDFFRTFAGNPFLRQ